MPQFYILIGLGLLVIVMGLFMKPLTEFLFKTDRSLFGRDPERLITDKKQYIAAQRFIFLLLGVILVLMGVFWPRMIKKNEERLRIEREMRTHSMWDDPNFPRHPDPLATGERDTAR